MAVSGGVIRQTYNALWVRVPSHCKLVLDSCPMTNKEKRRDDWIKETKMFQRIAKVPVQEYEELKRYTMKKITY